MFGCLEGTEDILMVWYLLLVLLFSKHWDWSCTVYSYTSLFIDEVIHCCNFLLQLLTCYSGGIKKGHLLHCYLWLQFTTTSLHLDLPSWLPFQRFSLRHQYSCLSMEFYQKKCTPGYSLLGHVNIPINMTTAV